MKKVLKEIVVYSDGRIEFREASDCIPFAGYVWCSSRDEIGFQGYTLKECRQRALDYYESDIKEQEERLAMMRKNFEFIKDNSKNLKLIENQK